jgi:hypothetical protein
MSFVAILKIGGLRVRLVCLGFQSWFISYCWNRVTGWSMKDLNTFLNFPTLNVWQQVWFSTLVMRVRFHTSPEARMVWSTFLFPRCQIFPIFFVDGTDEQIWPLKTWLTFRSHSISSQEWKIQKSVLKFTLYHNKNQSVIHSQQNAGKNKLGVDGGIG